VVDIVALRTRPGGRERAQGPQQEEGRQDHSPAADHLQVRHRHVRAPFQGGRLSKDHHDVNPIFRHRSISVPTALLEPYRQPLHT